MYKEGAGGGGGGLTIVQTCTDTEADDASTCDFASNVTSGNRIVCILASGETSSESNLSGGGLTWLEEVDVTGSQCSIEIFSTTATSTAAVDPTYNWDATASAATSIACLEFSGASDVVGFAADTDADNPQAESVTTTAGAYVVGAHCDWNATDAASRAYISSPAHTELLYHRDASWYSVGYYRSTNTVAGGALSFGIASGWANPGPTPNSQAIAEIRP